jgi:hypothetical protein
MRVFAGRQGVAFPEETRDITGLTLAGAGGIAADAIHAGVALGSIAVVIFGAGPARIHSRLAGPSVAEVSSQTIRVA